MIKIRHCEIFDNQPSQQSADSLCSTLLAGKYQLLDTIYSKENGVHVRQLG